jgi:hypothetical protein
MAKRDQLLRIIAQLDGLFASDDVSPADKDRWKELKRHVTRMRSSLGLVVTSISKMRELGMPMTDDEARKIEGYARFGRHEVLTSRALRRRRRAG